MMCFRNVTCVFVCVLVCFLAGGCEDPHRATDKAALKILSLEEELGELRTKLQETERQREVLLTENRRLTDRHAELAQWADRTVSRFGPGIWYVHDLIYPFFVKPMKKGGVPEIIEELNRRFRKNKLPEVIYLGQEGATVMVGVSDDDLLTRKLGSFGAASYMHAVMFSLTSLEEVACVTYKFEEGDHAVPGTRCKRFFEK